MGEVSTAESTSEKWEAIWGLSLSLTYASSVLAVILKKNKGQGDSGTRNEPHSCFGKGGRPVEVGSLGV